MPPEADRLKAFRLTAGGLRKQAKMLLIALLVLGASTSTLIALRPAPAGTAVVIAVADLAVGDTVSGANTRVISLPEGAVPSDAVLSLEQVADRALTRPIRERHVLSRADFDLSGAQVPQGFARLMIEFSHSTANVAPGSMVQIWGPPDACDGNPASTQLERLATAATVESVSFPASSAFGQAVLSEVTLLVPSEAVASVLCAGAADQLHFVTAPE